MKKGIAYIEVLIASAILTVALIPTFGNFANLIQSQTMGENLIKVRNITETQIELARSKSIDELVEGQQTIDIDQLPSGQITTKLTNLSPAQPTLYRFEVEVRWNAPGGQKSYRSATLINPT